MRDASANLKVAAMGDLHVSTHLAGAYTTIFSEISSKADILVLCGDLTHTGLPKEAELLATDLTALKIPVVGVLGNHDHASGKHQEIKKILSHQGNMVMLEDEEYVFKNIGFAGTKGFAGGFGPFLLGAFGEEMVKRFVEEAIEESLKLETSLQSLDTKKLVVALHYSPIEETLHGEPTQLFPFLGSSRLCGPIEDYNVTAVFHAHAHKGKAQGKTPLKNIAVYNVSKHVLNTLNPNNHYVIIEI